MKNSSGLVFLEEVMEEYKSKYPYIDISIINLSGRKPAKNRIKKNKYVISYTKTNFLKNECIICVYENKKEARI